MILGVIAVALFAFIVLYERHSLTSGELGQRRGRLLDRFVRDRVERIEIEREGETYVMVRDRDEDELGTWKITSPIEALADEDAVFSLLGALEWADARRSFESLGAEERARFGLDEPVLRARFGIANETLQVAFGGEDPTGVGVYFQANEEDEAHVVGRDVFEALDHDLGHFRSKRLLERGVLAADALRLQGSEGVVALEAEGEGRGVWNVTGGGLTVLASRGRVEEALQTFTDLEAERYVTDAPESLATYGLDAPVFEATATSDEREVALRVGSACERDGEVYVRVDEGAVACVLASRLDSLRRPLPEWREDRAVTVRDLELESLRLEAGEDVLTLAHTERWTYEATLGGREVSGDVDDEALAEWMRAIRAARATEILAAENLGAHGLETPVATLRLEAGDERVETLHLGSSTLEGAYAKREGEEAILRVDGSLAELLTVSPVRFRERALIEEDRDDFSGASLTRGGLREEIAQQDGDWRIVAPVEAPADRSLVADVIRRVSDLEAERFVADSAALEHGLEEPRIVVRARYGETEHVLEVGAATEGGAFARLGGEAAVFVLRDFVVSSFEAPLVQRSLLATDVLYQERLVLRRESGEVEVRHDGAQWVTPEGPANEERAGQLADRIEQLRIAGTTHYGPPAPDEGLTPPRAVLVVERADDAGEPRRYEVLLGGSAGEGRVHVRRADLAVGLLLTAEDVDAILAFTP